MWIVFLILAVLLFIVIITNISVVQQSRAFEGVKAFVSPASSKP